MRRRNDPIKRDRLWQRYWAIKDEHKPGLYEPILWHLALGGDASAMVTLGDSFQDRTGRIADSFSCPGLCYRAHRAGYEYAAQHLAMDAFNRGDMKSYRHWLRKSAKFDPDSARQLKRFETRLPHANAARGRKRPYQKYDFE